MAGLHFFQLSYWQSGSGYWYVNDTTNLSGRSAKWYTPMRILGLSVDDYINLLLKYNAKDLKYFAPTDCFTFCFEKEKDAKAFCSYVNTIAKRHNYCCA